MLVRISQRVLDWVSLTIRNNDVFRRVGYEDIWYGRKMVTDRDLRIVPIGTFQLHFQRGRRWNLNGFTG